jgi:hypothetical protein
MGGDRPWANFSKSSITQGRERDCKVVGVATCPHCGGESMIRLKNGALAECILCAGVGSLIRTTSASPASASSVIGDGRQTWRAKVDPLWET